MSHIQRGQYNKNSRIRYNEWVYDRSMFSEQIWLASVQTA